MVVKKYVAYAALPTANTTATQSPLTEYIHTLNTNMATATTRAILWAIRDAPSQVKHCQHGER